MGILNELFIEKRSISRSADDFARGKDLLGALTNAGTRITEFKAMQINAVFGCVRIISQAVAKTPVILWEKSEKNGKPFKKVAELNEVYNLISNNPNKNMTPFQFKEKSMLELLLWGNSYWAIKFDKGKRVGLIPLYPSNMEIEVDDNFNKIYKYTIPNTAKVVRLLDYEVLHFAGMGYDGIKGFSPISMQRETLGIDLALTEYHGKFFANGSNMGGVISFEGKLSKESELRLKASFEEKAKGLENAHKVILLDAGGKYEQLRMNNDDAQLLESRRFSTAQISNIYGVPLHLLGELERSTNNNIEQQGRDFLNFCISPWLKRIEETINAQLFYSWEKPKYYAEFDTSEFTIPDAVSRAMYLTKLHSSAILSANECRAFESYNDYEGGDLHYRQANLSIVENDKIGVAPDSVNQNAGEGVQ